MNGKIILNLAISLDCFIADEDGGYDWIDGQSDKSLDTKEQMNFKEFLEDIDVVVMGKRSYEQNFSTSNDYHDKIVYVTTHEKIADQGNIRFISDNVVSIIQQEKKDGKNIYLFGGGVSLDQFIKADVIDEYIIGIIPIILGKGRPLFLGNNPTISLHLKTYSVSDGVVVMKYTKRK